MGGGEYSYLDLIAHLPEKYPVIASLPSEDLLAARIREKGIPTVIIPLAPINPTCIFKMVNAIRQIKDVCKMRNIHLIYANGSRAAFYGGLAGRLCSIPVIWHCRVSEADPYLDFILLRLVNRIVANSQATASRFSSRYQNKIDKVYNGIALKWFRDEEIQRPSFIENDWVVILVVARVSKLKRHDLILSAFEKVALDDKNIHLICVGGKDHSEPDWWNELQEKTKRSPFSDRVHWIGSVDDIRPWYRGASVMVLSSSNESFGRVVVEAMASGVPVIATRSGGIPEIVTHMQNGMLVPENDSEAIASAIVRILHDSDLKERIREEGLKHAEIFSIDVHIENMLRIFDQALN